MIPRHEHMYPREDRIRLVSSVTCGEPSVRAPTENKSCPLYFHYTPGSFPTPRWSPFDWPRWRCCPRCHTGVSERRSRLRSPARGLSLAGSSRSHLSLHTRQRIACLTSQTLNVLTNPEPEVVERVLVDDVKLPHQRESKLHHRADVHVLPVMFLRDVQKWATSKPCVQLVINCTVVITKRGGCEWIHCTNTGWKVFNDMHITTWIHPKTPKKELPEHSLARGSHWDQLQPCRCCQWS